MEKSITILAPAKINLFLDVAGRRDDGYHDLLSVMQTVGVFDRISVTRKDADDGEKSIEVNCDNGAPRGEENTVYRAAEAFFKRTGEESYNVSFFIEKRIPSMSGLGGGSSDAAAALIALDQLFGSELQPGDLISIGESVGSDVPFCIKKGTCVVTGRGEKLESCAPMPDCVMVIAVPNEEKISTAEAYSLIDVIDAGADIGKMISAVSECSLEKMGDSAFNKFEYVLPATSSVPKIKNILLSHGAKMALMSGSGPSVFALFDSVASAKSAAEALSDEAETFVCSPVRRAYRFIEEN